MLEDETSQRVRLLALEKDSCFFSLETRVSMTDLISTFYSASYALIRRV